VASLTGACVFAVVTGAGAVFVGDWWGQHHGPVVTVFVTAPASVAQPGHTIVASSPQAASSHRRTGRGRGVTANGDVQADAKTAQVARTKAARRHPAASATPAPVTPTATTVGPVTATPSAPTGTESGPVPAGTAVPVITVSPRN
jgi:hypothetical protein